jgi:hypothetical protein
MGINISGFRIDNCHIGISAPKDANMKIEGLEISNTYKAFELRDPPSLLQSLGLPPNTPPVYLIEALRILEGSSKLESAARIEKLRESNLVKWLGVTADLTSLGVTLLSAQAQGLVSSVAERIFG